MFPAWMWMTHSTNSRPDPNSLDSICITGLPTSKRGIQACTHLCYEFNQIVVDRHKRQSVILVSFAAQPAVERFNQITGESYSVNVWMIRYTHFPLLPSGSINNSKAAISSIRSLASLGVNRKAKAARIDCDITAAACCSANSLPSSVS